MAKLNAAKPEAGIQITAQVEREIAAVAKKIRLNDLITGAALLLVGTLAYAVVAILLDKWLTLPAWVRQLGFVGFLTTILGLAYFAIVRPLTRVVNPRYVARQVEATMPESKNELINWVDLQEQEMADSVKSALASRAAAGFGDADVESAVRSRKFQWLGGAAAVLFALLAVLFLVFKGTQFGSLLSRAFNPFQSSTAIASRTTIDVIEPTDPDATVADGDQIRFAIRLGGRVPDANAADKVRLKVRYNADAAEPEEIAFAKTETLRDFELILTRGTIQNGFWYTIAAGDAETPEHRITVRTKPMLKGFEVNYEYPAYLRIAPSQNADPKLRGYPGTKVRVQVQTNREVKSGSMMIEPRGEAIDGTVFGEKNGSLRFAKTLDRPSQYRIAFASTAGEASGSSIAYPIEILPDYSPAISIEKPATEEITLPTNGLLEVDATVTDDFGIENTTLQFNIANGPKIAGKKYLNAASFKRDKDGTFPTRVDYKDSVKLDQLKDDAGKSVPLQAGQVLEFWLEAKDNCTVLPHDLGKSKKIRVNLVAPPAKPEESKKQDDQTKERQQRDEKHQQQEKNKQDNEPRAAPQDPNQKGEPGDQKKPGNEGQAEQPPMEPNGPMGEPMMNPGEKDVEKKAEDLQTKIDEKNQRAGEGKANTNAQEPEGAESPKTGEKKPGEQGPPSAESKPGEAGEKEPMTQPPGEDKGAGKVQPPQPSEAKPEPNQKAGDESRPEAQATGDSPKTTPKSDDKPGEEKKPQPEGMQPMDQPKAGEKPQESQAGGGKNEEPQKSEAKPESGKAKRDGAPKPGEEKETQKSGAPGEDKAPPEERSSQGKGEKPAESGSKKPEPKGPPPADTGMEKTAPEPKPGEEAGNNKGEGAKPAEAKGEEKRTDRKPTKEEIEKLGQDAKDLENPDGAKQKAAEERLDKAVGKENREKMQKNMQDRAAADKKKIEEGAKQEGGKEPTKEELEQLAKDAKDLDSTDPAKRKAAEQKLDKAVGKENREKIQQGMKDREAADKKNLEDAANQAQKPKEPTKDELDELAKNAKDLNSTDADKKKAVEEKVDKAVGKDAREQIQKEMKDRDAAKAEAEKKKFEDAAKQAAKAEADKTPGAKPKQPTKEEIEKMAQAAKDLDSSDAGKKSAAEKQLDQTVGKEARERLQKDLKELQGDDPKKSQEARDRLEKMAKEWQPGNGSKGQDGKPLVDNPENRLKSAELQLDDFKKYKGDKNFLRDNNMSDAEYEKFLKGYEEMVDRKRKDADDAKLNPLQARPQGPGTVGANDGSSVRVKAGPTAGTAPGAAGPSFAPPGFSEAQRDFAKEARDAIEQSKKKK